MRVDPKRRGPRAGVAALLGVLACGTASIGAPAAGGETPARTLEVTYSSAGALTRLLRAHPAEIVRRVPELRLVEVRPLERGLVAAATHTRGITAVRFTTSRAVAAEPALQLGLVSTPAGGAYEWQYYATHADQVPQSVLAAARRVTIAVLDTGADLTAPALVGKISGHYDAATGGHNVSDATGHGTFVASLAGGGSVGGSGVAGFGGDARLLIVKIGNSEKVNDVAVAGGIVYAVKHGARIINLSIAGRSASPVEARAVEYAAAHDVLLVAAAGNDALAGNPPEYPAALLQPVGSNGVGGLGLTVGASGFDGLRAPFSEYGSSLSLVAPGLSVFGAVPGGPRALQFTRTQPPGAAGGSFAFASGTSFAAPQVAGAAALVWAAAPRLHAASVASILERTASGGGRWTPDLGFGVLDVARAVAAAQAS